MTIQKIDGNSKWVGPTKDKSQGKMIKVRTTTLLQMNTQGIVLVYQILDNKISELTSKNSRTPAWPINLSPHTTIDGT